MKKTVHPSYGPVIYRDVSVGQEWLGMSTKLDGPTEVRDGVTYHVISLEISSLSHPFYSGKKSFVDSAGRVDKFAKRFNTSALRSRKATAKAGGEKPAE